MKWIVLLSYPFFLFPCLLTGQTPKLHPIFEEILELNFKNFTSHVNPVASNDYESLYYSNMYDILSLLFQENKDQYEHLKKRENQRLKWLNDQEKETALKGFVAAEIKLQWAFVHLKYGREWPAFWGLRKSQKLINENIARYSNFEANQRTKGALQLIFGMVPKNRQWAFRLFQLSGTVKAGINSLEKVEQKTPLAYESSVIQILIQTHLLENHDQARVLLLSLPYADKPLTSYFKILVAFKSNQGLKARQLLQESKHALPYQSYFLGETYFQEGRYPEAVRHYERFIAKQTEGNYIKDAYTKIALSQRFINNLSGYRSALKKAKTIANPSTEIDKNAGKLIEQMAESNDQLLQLRFALDGGFNERAQQLIKHLSEQNITPLENIELMYRKAQYELLLQHSDAAIKAYQHVLQQEYGNSSPYFIPNSALQLGLIYQRRGNEEQAAQYFNQVLNFDDHPYKSSLDAKAQIAIYLLQASDDK